MAFWYKMAATGQLLSQSSKLPLSKGPLRATAILGIHDWPWLLHMFWNKRKDEIFENKKLAIKLRIFLNFRKSQNRGLVKKYTFFFTENINSKLFIKKLQFNKKICKHKLQNNVTVKLQFEMVTWNSHQVTSSLIWKMLFQEKRFLSFTCEGWLTQTFQHYTGFDIFFSLFHQLNYVFKSLKCTLNKKHFF